ncbi:MAG TPA: CDP-glycerol glycerophosphotransferase family protein [Tenericutes bacterium]|nr:CDP-glycerol glycerophosphotransferase family protein [Mycoplasmatota bacterium]
MLYVVWIIKQIGNLIYTLLKILPTMNKVVLITRRSKKTPIDFMMLKEKINYLYPSTKVVVLNHKLKFKLMLPIHIIIEMYHLATSRSAIIDSYIIPISVYKHKKQLKIIQIWHALGAIKKFGYATLGKNEGSNNKIANFMKMHKNYDYVICGSNEMIDNYSKCFNIDKSKIKPYGMPRVDYLLSVDKNKIKNEIYSYYNLDKTKKTILYAPTFRKKKQIQYCKFIEQVDFKKYNLIIKKHHLDKSVIKDHGSAIIDNNFDVMNLAIASDYIVTDYSAITFEAAILEKPLFFYVYDIKKYKKIEDYL